LEADLENHESLHEAFEGVDTVYNLAFPEPYEEGQFERFLNLSLRNLLHACIEFRIRNFVSLSTIEVYGIRDGRVDTSSIKPRSKYSRAKAKADMMISDLARNGINVGIVRSARALGRYDTSLSLPLAEMVDDGFVVIPDFEAMSFSHPFDIANCLYNLSKREESFNLLNIKSFDCSSFSLVSSISRYIGREAQIKKPRLFRRSELPPYVERQLKEHPFLEEEKWADYGYMPSMNLETVSKEIADWYREKNRT
jgi:nucleoside-diphosphate-sugar epimerase